MQRGGAALKSQKYQKHVIIITGLKRPDGTHTPDTVGRQGRVARVNRTRISRYGNQQREGQMLQRQTQSTHKQRNTTVVYITTLF